MHTSSRHHSCLPARVAPVLFLDRILPATCPTTRMYAAHRRAKLSAYGLPMRKSATGGALKPDRRHERTNSTSRTC